MKILFVTSECAPFSKSGGLADVAFSLPPALQRAGNEIAIITPLYRCVRTGFGDSLTKVKNCKIRLGQSTIPVGLYRGERDGVTVWFVDYAPFFNRPKLYGYDDDKLRFAMFSKAVIDLLSELDFKPEILHCNDWETALTVIYLKNDQYWNKNLQGIKTVFTIHNIAYQGQFSAKELTTTFALPEGWYDGGLGYEFEGRRDVNLMKGAMLIADAVSTVSPNYARELHSAKYGMGLEKVADMVEHKLYGILNGIDMDHYDPALDKRLPKNFSPRNMKGKQVCKASIQRKFGLDEEPEFPLLASVARLNEQKGIELIKEILPAMMEMGIQLIVFGQGEQKYIDYFENEKKKWPGQLGFSSDYTEQMASEVFAGADMYLMPSRFEPCGLSQMMAMRMGTVPIVHETGGLKDSVRPYSSFDGIGDGFSFVSYQSKALYLAIQAAVKIYFGDKPTFKLLQKRGMTKDFSWTRSAEEYNRMYSEIYVGGAGEPIPFDEAFDKLKDAYTHLDTVNRNKLHEINKNSSRLIQVEITGPGAGIFHILFHPESIEMVPGPHQHPDATIYASYEHLMGMAEGKYSPDRLFMTGQMKITGNIAKAAEMRYLLALPNQSNLTDEDREKLRNFFW
ncbi:MAG: glycogen/starch synthase [Anaerolineaceae bacterium]|nr:glycogen/starch synthase [Anaerolineaceae bacterium]